MNSNKKLCRTDVDPLYHIIPQRYGGLMSGGMRIQFILAITRQRCESARSQFFVKADIKGVTENGQYSYLKEYTAEEWRKRGCQTLFFFSRYNQFMLIKLDEIECAEAQLGFQLPSQLREFYLEIGVVIWLRLTTR
ncbi:SMI1/KNR4 family protein [Candidatus Bealeia paramacronuclearis]|uniref:SMI1/KNR4 family protein n=1 Tax=Candidatus Bealeia paramacronuclearis TaxID=1921001 RepID=UPI002F266C64